MLRSPLERRRFLGELLAALPALSVVSACASQTPRANAPSTRPRRAGVLVVAGSDRFHTTHSIGVSTTAFKVAAADTDSSLFAMEHTNTKHGGPPLHLHHDVDEFWYVLAGEYLVEVGGERFTARAGDCVLGPREVSHRWAFVGDGSGRLLITFTPAGRMQEFFSRPRVPGAYTEDASLYRDFGMELLGPPLAV